MGQENKKYWEFKNLANDVADLYLYIEIASWGAGGYAHSAKSFKEELDDLGEIKVLNVYINSPGGDVFEGITIYNMLKRHKAHVNVYVDGLAASIASVIAMAGDTIIMPSNSMMMVHYPWTWGSGNAKDFKKLADDLDKIGESVIESYLNKVGDKTDKDTIVDLLDKETWLTAQECLDYGLCNEVVEEKQIAASVNTDILSRYKNTPKNLFKVAEKPVLDEETKLFIDRINNKIKLNKEVIDNE